MITAPGSSSLPANPGGGHVSVMVVGPSMITYAAQLRSVLPHPPSSSVMPSMTPHHMRVRLDVATPLGNEGQPKQANAHECKAARFSYFVGTECSTDTRCEAANAIAYL